jgi:hypothetical protein
MLDMTMDEVLEWALPNDEKCEPTSIAAKLHITSLNSHFAGFQSGTKCCEPSRDCMHYGKEAPTD